MLNAINTKILLAILAALTVIGGAVLYQRDQTAKAAAAATQSGCNPSTTTGRCINEQNRDGMNEAFRKQGRSGTRSVTTPPQPMKARPGRRTSRKP